MIVSEYKKRVKSEYKSSYFKGIKPLISKCLNVI